MTARAPDLDDADLVILANAPIRAGLGTGVIDDELGEKLVKWVNDGGGAHRHGRPVGARRQLRAEPARRCTAGRDRADDARARQLRDRDRRARSVGLDGRDGRRTHEARARIGRRQRRDPAAAIVRSRRRRERRGHRALGRPGPHDRQRFRPRSRRRSARFPSVATASSSTLACSRRRRRSRKHVAAAST